MDSFDASGFGWGLLASTGAVAILLGVTFVVAVRLDRHSVVDTVWGLGFVTIAAVTCALSSGHGDTARRLVVASLTAVWGIRLAVHIGRRARGRGEDRRYVELLARAPGNKHIYALKMVYLTQGVAMLWVSLPVQAAMVEHAPLGPLAWSGIAVVAVGLAFEAVGDRQLARFLAAPANAGKVMDQGLWRYTRHPNYFGDACVWWGLYLLAAGQLPGALTILSPVAMTALLTRGTGKALLERTMSSRRPGYEEYVRRTSGFFPLPPRAPQA